MNEKAEQSLKKDWGTGGITLVFGSGINSGSGLSDWLDLVGQLVRDFSEEHTDSEILNMLKADEDGTVQKSVRGRAALNDPLVYTQTLEQLSYAGFGGYTGTKALEEGIRKKLYGTPKQNYEITEAGTLNALGDLLIKDRISGHNKIRRVITLNVDSLLEEYLWQHREHIVPHPITHWHQNAQHYAKALDIYHLHGFLPSNRYRRLLKSTKKRQDEYLHTPEGLVFGDDQYWAMAASPASLPNVVMLNALHESHCIFIGLSMRDPNIARWLALRTNEIKASRARQIAGIEKAKPNYGAFLGRHYWIEAKPDPLTEAWLKSRGVQTLKIGSWENLGSTLENVTSGESNRTKQK